MEIKGSRNVLSNKEIRSIYFGGGTPSLLSPNQVEQVITTIRDSFVQSDFVEVTLEANPGTEIAGKAEGFFEAGINRISLGVQSSLDRELRLLDRIHTHQQTCLAVKELRKAGFQNINLDLIYGIPGQKLITWKTSLQKALELLPEHLSLYSLTLEPSVKLGRQVNSGKVHLPTDDEMAEMYDWAMEYLEENGCDQYEISNWARQDNCGDLRSWHNLQYWRAGEYLGIGAGAHGYLGEYRYENVHKIETYITRMNSEKINTGQSQPALYRKHKISEWESMLESMMLGLRLTQEGVNRKDFHNRYGKDLFTVFSIPIKKLLEQGIIENCPDNECIRLTKYGRQIGNVAFREFVAIPEPTEINKQ